MEREDNRYNTQKTFSDGESEQLSLEEKISRLNDVTNELLQKQKYMDHHLEHELIGINDHISNVLGKLEKREDVSEARIKNVEEVIIHFNKV